MAALQWGNELYGSLVLGDYIVDQAPGGNASPLVIPIAHPRPASNIAINRMICRIHILAQPSGLYSTALICMRASDQTIIGATLTDTVSRGSTLEVASRIAELSERELQFDPNYYKLAIGDSLLATFTTYGLGQYAGVQPANKTFKASLDIVVGYYVI